MPTQFVGGDGALWHIVADQSLQTRTVLTYSGHGLLDGGMFLHRHLHFAQFDAVAPHLHLTVDPPFVIDLAIG